MRRKIAVLMGGVSAEREVSLKSGKGIAEALRQKGHEVHEVDLAEESIAPVLAVKPEAGLHRPARPVRRGRRGSGTARRGRHRVHRLRPAGQPRRNGQDGLQVLLHHARRPDAALPARDHHAGVGEGGGRHRGDRPAADRQAAAAGFELRRLAGEEPRAGGRRPRRGVQVRPPRAPRTVHPGPRVHRRHPRPRRAAGDRAAALAPDFRLRRQVHRPRHGAHRASGHPARGHREAAGTRPGRAPRAGLPALQPRGPDARKRRLPVCPRSEHHSGVHRKEPVPARRARGRNPVRGPLRAARGPGADAGRAPGVEVDGAYELRSADCPERPRPTSRA